MEPFKNVFLELVTALRVNETKEMASDETKGRKYNVMKWWNARKSKQVWADPITNERDMNQ